MTNFWLVLSAATAAALVPPMHQVGSQTGAPGTEADAVAELVDLQNDRHNRLTVPVLINGNMDFADRLKIGAMELRRIPINYADAPVFEALDMADRPALILGMEELRSLDRVAIDFTTNRVLFDVPAAYLNQGLVRQKFFPSRIRRH